ncbi:MAG: KAP family NTPase [Cyanobacteria bacterium]|nr:KAP family NTPase [Cyanobacteriota bacterium]
MFEIDKPLGPKDPDLLGRNVFSKKIADEILNWDDNQSLILALYGDWGSGKTSVLNQIKLNILDEESKVIENADSKITIIDFNPWAATTKIEIIKLFFEKLIHSVESENDKQINNKKLIKVLKKYSDCFSIVNSVSEGINALPVVIGLFFAGLRDWFLQIIVDNTAIFPSYAIGQIILNCLFILVGFILAVIKYLPDILNKYIGIKERDLESESTLFEIKKKLISIFCSRKKKYLILVDDIDRLPPEEIKLIFQFIKCNADFPNFIYLLPFQRDIVEKSVSNNELDIDGAKYLEKIITVGLDIPFIESEIIQNQLTLFFEKIIAEYKLIDSFNFPRWSESSKLLLPYLTNFRELKSYQNSFRFHLTLLVNEKNEIEINFIDLALLLIIKTFEPYAYNQLPHIRSLLTAHDHLNDKASIERNTETRLRSFNFKAGMKDPLDSNDSKVFEDYLSNSKTNNRSSLLNILDELFPNLLEGPESGSQHKLSRKHLLRARRIAHPYVFEWYFVLKQPLKGVSVTELTELTGILDNMDYGGVFDDLFIKFIRENRFMQALKTMCAYVDSIDPDRLSELFRAIGDTEREFYLYLSPSEALALGDSICNIMFDFLELTSDDNSNSYIPSFEESLSARHLLVHSAIVCSKNLYLMGRFLYFIELKNPQIFDKNQFNHLKETWVNHCLKYHSLPLGHNDLEHLINVKRLEFVLSQWYKWSSDREQVKNWVREWIEDPSHVPFLKLIDAHCRSPLEGYSIVTLLNYVELDVLRQKAQILDSHTLPASEFKDIYYIWRSAFDHKILPIH